MGTIDKPLLSSYELIKKMKDKGITFNYCTEKQAQAFLENNNNYFRISAYRKNYDKYPAGKNKGKYRYLDFSYLQELSTIDMHMRFLIIKMCLDIEHCLKLDLLRKAEQIKDDGFDSINTFFQDKASQNFKNSIYYKRRSPYCSDLLNHNFIFDENKGTIKEYKEFRIWALLEVMTFGDLIHFCNFYHSHNNIENKYKACINSVKSIRNACAHNNCILANLNKNDECKANRLVSDFVSHIDTIRRDLRKSQLKIFSIYEITNLIYVYKELVSDKLKEYRFKELKDFVNGRMISKKDFFNNQEKIKASYKFVKRIVDSL